jgi:hypothetical protein
MAFFSTSLIMGVAAAHKEHADFILAGFASLIASRCRLLQVNMYRLVLRLIQKMQLAR